MNNLDFAARLSAVIAKNDRFNVTRLIGEKYGQDIARRISEHLAQFDGFTPRVWRLGPFSLALRISGAMPTRSDAKGWILEDSDLSSWRPTLIVSDGRRALYLKGRNSGHVAALALMSIRALRGYMRPSDAILGDWQASLAKARQNAYSPIQTAEAA